MNILTTCMCWFEDTIGGSFYLAMEHAKAMVRNGNQVRFICCGLHQESHITREVRNGVELWRYPRPAENYGSWKRMQHHVYWSRQAAAQAIVESRPDVFVGHSPVNTAGCLRVIPKDIPFTYGVHSPFPDEFAAQSHKTSLKRTLRVAMANRLEKRIIARADSIIGSSLFTKGRLQSLYGESCLEKFVLVPGIVDLEKFLPVDDRLKIREQLGPAWSGSIPTFFTLRRLESRMGIEDLVTAVRLLRQSGREFRVLIGGSGSLRESLDAQIREEGSEKHCQLLGRVSDEDLPLCYAAADCFALPTRALECFGLIALESFACQTPVIGSDAGAIPELVNQQGAGWLFPAGVPDKLAERMANFLDGKLTPQVDLRQIAESYSYSHVMPQWCDAVALPASRAASEKTSELSHA